MRTWIRNPLAAWTGGGADASGGLVVDGRTIAECLPAGGEPSAPVDVVFDASDCVLLPGLVNCHHHFYQTLTRAFPAALNKELFPWLQALYPVWAGLDREAIVLSTRLALAELMLSGCTLATRGSMSLGESAGGLPPDTVVQPPEQILADSERLITRYHEPGRGAMVQVALAPCSPFSVTDELMRDSAALARRHSVRLHTHLAETHDENAFCLQVAGKRPLDYLESLGWLADDVWLAHGIHFDDEEVARLGAAGVGIAHCPSSNMVLASGTCRVRDLEAAGCPVGLGVDGSASNDASNMIAEVRQALLLQRLRDGSANVTHEDALRWATAGGAALYGRDELGTLAPGQAADLGLYALDALRFSGAGDPVAALVLCGAHSVRHLMIAGEWRVEDGSIPGLDIDALRAAHDAAARRLRGG